jgi:hypothetical protein
MSDERGKIQEQEGPELESEDVEAHGMQPPGGLQPPGYKGGPGRNDDDDDVEAHKLQ